MDCSKILSIHWFNKGMLFAHDTQSDLNSYESVKAGVIDYGYLNEEWLKYRIEEEKKKLALFQGQLSFYSDSFNPTASGSRGITVDLAPIRAAIIVSEAELADLKARLEAYMRLKAKRAVLFKDSLEGIQLVIKGITALNQIGVDSFGNYSTDGIDISGLTVKDKNNEGKHNYDT